MPIDVAAFMDRQDIPADAKRRVKEAAAAGGSDAEKYRLMQTQILFEVVRLDKQRWKPKGNV